VIVANAANTDIGLMFKMCSDEFMRTCRFDFNRTPVGSNLFGHYIDAAVDKFTRAIAKPLPKMLSCVPQQKNML